MRVQAGRPFFRRSTSPSRRLLALALVASLLVSLGPAPGAVAAVGVTANAGPDSTLESGALVALAGSGSTSAARPLTFSWSQLSGPTVALSNMDAASTTFYAPVVTSDTVLEFRLEVSDGLYSASDDVRITVTPSADPQPQRLSASPYKYSSNPLIRTESGRAYMTYADNGAAHFARRDVGDGRFSYPANLSGLVPGYQANWVSSAPQIASRGATVAVAFDGYFTHDSPSGAVWAVETCLAISYDYGESFTAKRITSTTDAFSSHSPRVAIAEDGRVYLAYRRQSLGGVSTSTYLEACVYDGSSAEMHLLDGGTPSLGETYAVGAIEDRACIVYESGGKIRMSTWVAGSELSDKVISGTQVATNPRLAVGSSLFLVAWEQYLKRPLPAGSSPSEVPTHEVWSAFVGAPDTVYSLENRSQSPDTDSRSVAVGASRSNYWVGWLEGNQESSATRDLMLASTGAYQSGTSVSFKSKTTVSSVTNSEVDGTHAIAISGDYNAVHVAWSGTGPVGAGSVREIYLAESSDAGLSFSRAKRISNSVEDSYDPTIGTIDTRYVSAWVTGLSWYISQPRGIVFTRSGGFSRDIAITGAEMVQAAFGAGILADGHRTKLRVKLFNGNGTDEQVRVHYEIRTANKTGPDSVLSGDKDVALPSATTHSVYLPDDSFSAYGKNVMATVSIAPVNPNANTDASNDATGTQRWPVAKTKGVKIGYTPLNLPGDHARTRDEVVAWGSPTQELIKAMLPVPYFATTWDLLPSVMTSRTLESGGAIAARPTSPSDPRLTEQQQQFIWSDLERAAAFGDFDMMVGITDESFFRDRMGKGNILGLAPWCVPPADRWPVALLRWSESGKETVAHEMLHTYGWVNGEYEKAGLAGAPGMAADNMWSHTGLAAPGYWPDMKREYSSATKDLMYPFMSATVPHWVSRQTWDYMIGRLNTFEDPPVILLSGFIDAADTVTLDPWYRMDSVLDVELDQPGEITIEYRDVFGQPIASTGFTPSFADTSGGSSSLATFNLRVPDVLGTESVALIKDGVVLAVRTATANGPEVSVTAPNGGETLTAEETATVTWSATDADGDSLRSTVLLSTDGGANWKALAIDTEDTSLDFVPGKDDVTASALVKVITTDGLNTGQDASDAPFAIVPRPVPTTAYGEPVLQPTRISLGSGAPYQYQQNVSDGSLVAPGSRVYVLRLTEGHDDGTGTWLPGQLFLDVSDDSGATFTARHIAPLDGTNAVSSSSSNNGVLAASGDDVIVSFDAPYGTYGHTPKYVISHDAGVTWSAALDCYPGQPAADIRKLMMSGDDVGMVLEQNIAGQETLIFIGSHDGGRTFDAPKTLGSTPYNAYGTFWAGADMEGERIAVVGYDLVPDGSTIPPTRMSSGLRVWTSMDAGRSFYPQAVVDTEDDIDIAEPVIDGDDLHIKYEAPAIDAVKVVTSHDGGSTFGSPLKLNTSARQTFQSHPARIDADGGTVAVTWESRDDVLSTRLLICSSQDRGDTFGAPVDVTQPHAPGYGGNVCVGGVAVSGNLVYGVWRGYLGDDHYTSHTILRVSTDRGLTFQDARDLCEAPHDFGWYPPVHPTFVADGANVYSLWSVYDDNDGSIPDWQYYKTIFRRGIGTAGGALGVEAGADQAIDEGAFAGVAATYSGASADETPTATIDWGDGTVAAGAVTDVSGTGSVSGTHAYTQAGTYAVRVTITDAGGSSGSDSFEVDVANTAPSVSAFPAESPSAVAGQRFALVGVQFGDAGAGEPYSATIDWGDGASTDGTVTVSADPAANGGTVGTVDGEHTYAAPGTYTARVEVSDGDASGEATMAIVAAGNAAPLADAGGPYEAYEGTEVSLDASRSTDPDGDALAYRWAAGGRIIGGLGNAWPMTTAIFADDTEGEIRLDVADGRGGTARDTAAFMILNADPRFFPIADRAVSVYAGESVEASGAFADAGRLDTHAATLDWGDGAVSAASISESQGAGVASGSHVYAASGTYTVTAAIADDDGGRTSTTFTLDVTVLNRPPVAADVTASTAAGTPLPVTLTATDPDGDALTWLPVPLLAPTSGLLSGTPPALTYTPKPGFAGTDLFAFQVSDGRGGSDVASVTVTVAPPPPSGAVVKRISGSDAYQVALSASREAFPAGTASGVVLATGENWCDALAASGLAGTLRGPVLLTRPSTLPSGLLTELQRLGAKRVYIVGGTRAIGTGVAAKLKDAGFTVARIAGANRYEVSSAVARKIEALRGNDRVSEAAVVRGDQFYEALAVSAVAYGRKLPVLYTAPGSLSTPAGGAIRALDVDEVIVCGNSNAIKPATAAAIGRLPSVDRITRLGGSDRIATSVAINAEASRRGWFTYSFVGVAGCTTSSDSLTAGAIAGYRGGPLLLVYADKMPGATSAVLKAHRAEVKTAWLFGRAQKVSEAVRRALVSALN